MSRSKHPGAATIYGPGDCYRSVLTRELNAGDKLVMCIGLNPSTADATENDPTITRIVGFAIREGAKRLVMCNLFALRSTDPKALYSHPHPEGDMVNLNAIADQAVEADVVICAWGTHGAHRDRSAGVMESLRWLVGDRLFCLGQTAEGFPKHPLYLPAAAPLVAFRGVR